MRRIWIRRRGKRNERRRRSMKRNTMIRIRSGRKRSWMGGEEGQAAVGEKARPGAGRGAEG